MFKVDDGLRHPSVEELQKIVDFYNGDNPPLQLVPLAPAEAEAKRLAAEIDDGLKHRPLGEEVKEIIASLQ